MRNSSQIGLPIESPAYVPRDEQSSPVDCVEPTVVDGCLELLKVRCSPEPVEGWIEVRDLSAYGGPGRNKPILERAWVDPKTIDAIYIQRYDGITPKGLPPMPPVAWGFGPKHGIARDDYVQASFDLVNPEDYERVLGFVQARHAEMLRKFGPEPLQGYYRLDGSEVPA